VPEEPTGTTSLNKNPPSTGTFVRVVQFVELKSGFCSTRSAPVAIDQNNTIELLVVVAAVRPGKTASAGNGCILKDFKPVKPLG
jgi:hypothetical protein